MKGVASGVILISPSQVRTYDPKYGGCPRKWAFDKIDQIPVATSPGAAFGSLVHARMDGYFARGDDVGNDRAGKVARALATCYPPPPHGDMLVEKELREDADGFAWRGKIDLIHQNRDGLVVCDHKTLRQPERYALNEDQLMVDVQALIYAHLAQQNFGVNEVLLQWTYAATQGAPKPYPVRVGMRREHVAKYLPALEATAKEILQARSVTTANDLPPNLNACGNYGGCPYAEHCVRTKEQRMRAIFNDEEDSDVPSLRDILKQRAGGAPEIPSPMGSGLEPTSSPHADPEGSELQRHADPPPPLRGNGAGKKPPPRVDVNAPEAPPTEQERVDISKRVGAGEDARALVEASAQGRDLDVAASEAKMEAFRKKSPQQYEILARCPARFARRKEAVTDDVTFAHGRTLNAMVKAGLVTVEEVSSKISNVTATPAGLALLGKAPPAASMHVVSDDKPTAEDIEAVSAGGLPGARPKFDDPLLGEPLAEIAAEKGLEFDDAPPPGATARDVWLRLAMKFGDKPEIVEKLYASYLRYFPTG